MSSFRGPVRVMNEQAMGDEVFPTEPIAARGAFRLKWLVLAAASTVVAMQVARSGGAWQTINLLNSNADAESPEWKEYFVEFLGGCPWDWARLLFHGALSEEGTETLADWAFDTPLELATGYFVNRLDPPVVVTATTDHTLVEDTDYEISADGRSITPLSGGALADFATDGGLIVKRFAITADGEVTADGYCCYGNGGAEPGTPTGMDTPSGLEPATGDPPAPQGVEPD